MVRIIQYNRYGRAIATWSSLDEAATMTATAHTAILRSCEYKVIQTGGYVWRYA